ncbi:MAG TPA: ATP-binding protein, partial [Chthoniobacteraceae bacterium]|nr:ATP-binding protein [Chthoniobacteraceae bacterium]
STVEIELRRGDKSTVPAQLIATPISAPGGKLQEIHAAIVSLVEIRAMERALEASEERLRLAIEAANAGTWEVDLVTGVLSGSEGFYALIRAHDGAHPVTISELIAHFHSAERSRCHQIFGSITDGDVTDFYGEFRLASPGLSRWIAMNGRVNHSRGHSRLIGIAMDITGRREAVEILRKSRILLERRVRMRTAALREANETLEREVAERRRLEREILEISEREQSRIGRDLHDGLGQQITGIMLMNNLLQESLDGTEHSGGSLTARLSELLGEAKTQLRQVVRGLQPVAQEPNGLMVGLADLVRNCGELSRVECAFDCPQPVLISDNVVATHLFRIAQEAVNNASRHAHAKRLAVSLARARKQIVLEIRDDGRGIRLSKKKSEGFGLRIMRYRAEAMGGTFSVRGLPSGGTLVQCAVPDTAIDPTQLSS